MVLGFIFLHVLREIWVYLIPSHFGIYHKGKWRVFSVACSLYSVQLENGTAYLKKVKTVKTMQINVVSHILKMHLVYIKNIKLRMYHWISFKIAFKIYKNILGKGSLLLYWKYIHRIASYFLAPGRILTFKIMLGNDHW